MKFIKDLTIPIMFMIEGSLLGILTKSCSKTLVL